MTVCGQPVAARPAGPACRARTSPGRPAAALARMGLLEWTHEDSTVPVRDGIDSYLIEDGKIVPQTIHSTLQKR
jgi:hypothetical protein